MTRSSNSLRCWIFPVVMLLGVATLAVGTVGWYRFHRALYAEEIAALSMAAETGIRIDYRRAGEPRPRVAIANSKGQKIIGSDLYSDQIAAWDAERAAAPWSVPFVGRIEAISVTSPIFGRDAALPPAIRDPLLRLPGMRSYVEAKVGSDPLPSLRPLLGPALPTIPESELTPEDFDREIPRGRPLDEAERTVIASRIAESRTSRESLDAYSIRVRLSPLENETRRLRRSVRALEIVDAGRRISIDEFGSSRSRVYVPMHEIGAVRLSRDGETFLLDSEAGAWKTIGRIDPATPSPELRERRPRSLAETVAVLPTFESIDDLLGDRAPDRKRIDFPSDPASVVSVERIDDVRYRVEFESTATEAGTGDRSLYEVIAVVRSDFDFAVERYAIRLNAGPDFERPRYVILREAMRRLARAGTCVYAEETLERSGLVAVYPAISRPDGQANGYLDRLSMTVTLDPRVEDSAFDPRSYDPTPWPRPRTLPTVRAYRVAWGAGAFLFVLGGIGTLAVRTIGGRRRPGSDQAETNTRSGRRLPAFRFGIASLFAVALLVISAAGAIKAKLDVARRDAAILGRIDGEVDLVRREPGFPWFLFSTPALPIDAPPRRVAIRPSYRENEETPLDPEILSLLSDPKLERFRADGLRSVELAVVEREDLDQAEIESIPEFVDLFATAEGALVIDVPRPDLTLPRPEKALWLVEARTGEPLDAAAREAYVDRLASTWATARRGFPGRYLFVEDSTDQGSGRAVTLRDGERRWSIADRSDVLSDGGAVALTSDDGEFRYDYVFDTASNGGGSLRIERNRLDAIEPPTNEKRFWSDPQTDYSLGYGDAIFYFEDPDLRELAEAPTRQAPRPPFAFPRILSEEVVGFEAASETFLAQRPVAVERLDERRHRVDFAPFRFKTGDEFETAIKIAGFWAVVRDDLDGAVESCKFDETITQTQGPTGPCLRSVERTIYVVNRLERIADVVVPVATRIGYETSDERTWWDCRYAYDFSPRYDERIFRSVSASNLDPLPQPVDPPAIAWYGVTAMLGCGWFVVAGTRRVVDRLRSRKKGSGSVSAPS